MSTRPTAAGQSRAISSVRALTRLSADDAAAVVMEGRHDLYDAGSPGWRLRAGATLGDDVRQVVDDHLDVDTPARIDSVEILLSAAVAPLLTAFRGRLKLQLPDRRLMHVDEDAWAVAEVSASDGATEWWWTGVPSDSPDPLLVAETLHHVATRGSPEGGRRAASFHDLPVATCADCGGALVPVLYGYPAGEDGPALAQLGQIVLGGCTPPFDPGQACARCRKRAAFSETE